MRFIIANKIEDTYDELISSWWGKPKTLHLDACGASEYTDGYNIYIKNELAENCKNKLYFVNLGGYNSNEFNELQKNVFILVPNESKAKVKALKQILDRKAHHRDYQFEVEDILDVSCILSENKKYVHLEQTDVEHKFEFICKYTPIRK